MVPLETRSPPPWLTDILASPGPHLKSSPSTVCLSRAWVWGAEKTLQDPSKAGLLRYTHLFCTETQSPQEAVPTHVVMPNPRCL